MTILTVDSVSHYFGGVLAVDDVTFDVEPGGITGLVGPNGAGKTTLFSIIAGELRPRRGRIVKTLDLSPIKGPEADPPEIVSDHRSIWIADFPSGRIVRIDEPARSG